MKFKKLSLDESLFEDFQYSSTGRIDNDGIRWIRADDIFGSNTTNMIPSNNVGNLTYDDDFSSPEYMPKMETIPEGPKQGSDTGVADLLINSINDEWETIRQYNSLIATLKDQSANNPMYESFVTVINDITNEENKHVGQLQELLSKISPNTESIQDGMSEGERQFKLSGGLLPVQSWNNVNTDSTNIKNHVEETCSITNIDDEM